MLVDWKNEPDFQRAKTEKNGSSKSNICTLNCTLEEHKTITANLQQKGLYFTGLLRMLPMTLFRNSVIINELNCFVPTNDVPPIRHCEVVIERSRNKRSNPVKNNALLYFLDCFASSQLALAKFFNFP